jgi:hypothetical protein
MGVVTRELQPCGTVAAYHRHLKNGEPTCVACKQAWRVYFREWRAANPGKAARLSQDARDRANHGRTP